MSQKQRDFNILFRKPGYPLIVISVDKLMAAFNIKELAACCISARSAKLVFNSTKIIFVQFQVNTPHEKLLGTTNCSLTKN